MPVRVSRPTPGHLSRWIAKCVHQPLVLFAALPLGTVVVVEQTTPVCDHLHPLWTTMVNEPFVILQLRAIEEKSNVYAITAHSRVFDSPDIAALNDRDCLNAETWTD